MIWSTERMGVLRTMWLKGRSSGDIAKALGDVTRNAVMGKIDRMGLLRSEDHNTRMTATVFGACRPARIFARKPQPRPRPIDPRTVRLSRGTMNRACAGAERGVVPDWDYAASLVADLTGQEFSWTMPGHKASMVGIATMLVGDPRRILCPALGEPVVLGFMRRFATEGMVVGGKIPPRWCEMDDGDKAFFDDMLIVEDVRQRPVIVMRDPEPVAVVPDDGGATLRLDSVRVRELEPA